MTKAETELVAALNNRLQEITSEARWIVAKLKEYKPVQEAPEKPPRFEIDKSDGSIWAVDESGRPIEPSPKVDPSSRTSRMLAEARRILANSAAKALPFMDLYTQLGPDLKPATKNAREITRVLLKESGQRVGIQYVSANEVKLANHQDLRPDNVLAFAAK